LRLAPAASKRNVTEAIADVAIFFQRNGLRLRYLQVDTGVPFSPRDYVPLEMLLSLCGLGVDQNGWLPFQQCLRTPEVLPPRSCCAQPNRGLPCRSVDCYAGPCPVFVDSVGGVSGKHAFFALARTSLITDEPRYQ
jgi:hypothetical protein